MISTLTSYEKINSININIDDYTILLIYFNYLNQLSNKLTFNTDHKNIIIYVSYTNYPFKIINIKDDLIYLTPIQKKIQYQYNFTIDNKSYIKTSFDFLNLDAKPILNLPAYGLSKFLLNNKIYIGNEVYLIENGTIIINKNDFNNLNIYIYDQSIDYFDLN